jgi:shikimate kinase
MIVKTNGGISVLSAFINGYGAAASIDLPMYTEILAKESDFFPTPEIKDTVDFIRTKYSLPGRYSIDIKSRIPMGMGLKSSSAMTLSIIYGILKINGIDFTYHDIIKIGSEASIHNRTSITGATDDLSIAYFGGFCFTNNRKNIIISRKDLEERYILLYPGNATRETYSMKAIDFSGYVNFYDRLKNLLDMGLIYETMMLNGYIFDDGTDNIIIKKMLGNGASYAGRSGKGPAVFGIYETKSSMEESFDDLVSAGYSIIKSRFNNQGINISEP